VDGLCPLGNRESVSDSQIESSFEKPSQTPLHDGIESGCMPTIERHLDDRRMEGNKRNTSGCTILHFAVKVRTFEESEEFVWNKRWEL
jgi:hypothetical protein